MMPIIANIAFIILCIIATITWLRVPSYSAVRRSELEYQLEKDFRKFRSIHRWVTDLNAFAKALEDADAQLQKDKESLRKYTLCENCGVARGPSMYDHYGTTEDPDRPGFDTSGRCMTCGTL